MLRGLATILQDFLNSLFVSLGTARRSFLFLKQPTFRSSAHVSLQVGTSDVVPAASVAVHFDAVLSNLVLTLVIRLSRIPVSES